MSTVELRISEETLKEMLTHNIAIGEYRYVYINKGNSSEEVMSAGHKKFIQQSIKSSIRRLHDRQGTVTLKDISDMVVCEVDYHETASNDVFTNIQITENKVARVNILRLTEFLYKINRDEDSCKQCLTKLFTLVEGLEEDYNEYIFFRKHLEPK